jgi:diacylglycerol kinase (ATP)
MFFLKTRMAARDVAASLAERAASGPTPVGALLRATRNSLDGFAFALKSERAFRQEAVALALAVPLACALTPDPFHRALLIGVLMLAMAVELLNTCAEKICDLVMPQRHPMVKAVKDMGSAAVLCALGACLLLWGGAAMARLG